MCRNLRFTDKYVRITSVFSSEVSSWSTRDLGIMDLLNGLLAAKQIMKLWPEKGFGQRQTSFLSSRRQNPFLRDFLYIFRTASSLILNTRHVFCFMLFISVRSQGLHDAFFSAFYSEQINIMIYFYLSVFDSNDRNPSFHEKQLPVIAACSGFGKIFFMLRQAVYMRKLHRKGCGYSSW